MSDICMYVCAYERMSRYISNHPDICRDNLTNFGKKSQIYVGWLDIYLTWQTYVGHVIYVSDQIGFFGENDRLYIGMVGYISCLADIYRDNHDIYRGFR